MALFAFDTLIVKTCGHTRRNIKALVCHAPPSSRNKNSCGEENFSTNSTTLHNRNKEQGQGVDALRAFVLHSWTVFIVTLYRGIESYKICTYKNYMQIEHPMNQCKLHCSRN